MHYVDADIGIHTADAEDVSVEYSNMGLVLRFRDWKEQSRAFQFQDVLAFRWQEFDEQGIRDDVAYQVMESTWLARQSKLHGVPLEDYVHYKLCFNACGVLDILCREAAALPDTAG